MDEDQKVAQGLGRLIAGLAPRGHYYYHTSDMDAQLCYPHYSDPRFDGEGAIVFGARADGLTWDEGDDLRYGDYARYTMAWEVAAATCGEQRTARRTEAFLRLYHERPGLRLACIIARTDDADGYTRYRYGWAD